MLPVILRCAITGRVPTDPVTSAKTGLVYDRTAIEAALVKDNRGECPITHVKLASSDLFAISNSAGAAASWTAASSIVTLPVRDLAVPSMLRVLGAEWEASAVETSALRSQLESTRKELALALYQHDAAVRVVARLQRERDEARAALAASAIAPRSSNITSNNNNASNGTTTSAKVTKQQPPPQETAKNAVEVASTNTNETPLSDEELGKLREASNVQIALHKKRKAKSNAAADTNDAAAWQQQQQQSLFDGVQGVSCMATLMPESTKSESHAMVAVGNDKGSIYIRSIGSQEAPECVYEADESVSSSSSRGITAIQLFERKTEADSVIGTVFGIAGESAVLILPDVRAAAAVSQASARNAKPKGKGKRKSSATSGSEATESNVIRVALSAPVRAVAVHPTGEFAFAVDASGTFTIFRVQTGSVVMSRHFIMEERCAVAVHPFGQLFAVGGNPDGSIQVWDMFDASCKATLQCHANAVDSIAFSDNGYFITTLNTSKGEMRVFSLRNIDEPGTLVEGEQGSSAMAHGKGNVFASVSHSGRVELRLVPKQSSAWSLNSAFNAKPGALALALIDTDTLVILDANRCVVSYTRDQNAAAVEGAEAKSAKQE